MNVLGEKQKRKKSALGDSLLMFPWKRTRREMENKEERSHRLADNAARERIRREVEDEEERSRRLADNAAMERTK